MVANAIPDDALTLAVADGLNGGIAVPGSCDLVIANILAGPLVTMAADIVNVCRPGATILLAGLLASQAEVVLSAYFGAGAEPAGRLDRGEWAILTLARPDGRSGGIKVG